VGFREAQVLLRRVIVAASSALGRDGCGRCGFGSWVARVSAGALLPESDRRVSVVFATCRGPGFRSICCSARNCRTARGELLCTPRIVFRGLAPLAGKGRASARATTGDGRSADGQPSANVRSRSVQVSRCWLAISELSQGSARGRAIAPVTAPPGKGCHWPAECVTVRFVHAS